MTNPNLVSTFKAATCIPRRTASDRSLLARLAIAQLTAIIPLLQAQNPTSTQEHKSAALRSPRLKPGILFNRDFFPSGSFGELEQRTLASSRKSTGEISRQFCRRFCGYHRHAHTSQMIQCHIIILSDACCELLIATPSIASAATC